MTTVRKKLIEVALPLFAVNRGSEEDKNRKTGHIRNLHKWFAPMPLPAWRAMLFAALVDYPEDGLSPDIVEEERSRLFRIVERLADFNSYRDRDLISDAQREIARAVGDLAPTIVDPFCGGGSTLLEAQRLGLPVRGSDLNPVPVLITTVLCRIPSVFGETSPVNPVSRAAPKPHVGLGGFRSDVTHYASRVREIAWDLLKSYYPSTGSATPFAYRWAWTVASPDPSSHGAHTPLISNWVLSRHKSSAAWVEPVPANGAVNYRIRYAGDPTEPTTGRTAAKCIYTGSPIPLEYIREQGRSHLLRQEMFAIGVRENDRLVYVAPSEEQVVAANSVPNTVMQGIPMPRAALGFRVQQYGISNFLDLFTPRQRFAIETFANAVDAVHSEILKAAIGAGRTNDGISLEEGGTGARAYADAVTAVLGLCVGKMAQSNNILVRWFIDPRNGSGKATPAFDRHAVPMVWDFVETNPFGGSVGDWTGPVLETALRAFDLCVPGAGPTTVLQQDARRVADGRIANTMIATDPPYYSNIGYADLSDFFYLWLRESLRSAFPKLLSTVATPKEDELIATPFRHGGDIEQANQYFRSGFSAVFGQLAKQADPRFPIVIVYAIKQAEEIDETIGSTGWEVFLGGLVDAGLMIVATWPVRTTTDTRMIGIGNNALASAIFVVGRLRPSDSPTISLRDFLGALKSELPIAIDHLRKSNIAPVDLAQAAIGPGMGVYTRYAGILDASGKRLTVREALAIINQTLDEMFAEQESDFDRETRWALTWFEEFGFEQGEYGVAETLTKAKNTSVSRMSDAGILQSGAGKVRLLRPAELGAEIAVERGTELTAWEVVHLLIQVFEANGENSAAELVAKLGTRSEIARDLAYRLYTICERKKRSKEALSYNALVQSWPEIVRLSGHEGFRQGSSGDLFG
jgi:putative DNA methylase